MCNEMAKLEAQNTKLESAPTAAVAPVRDFKDLDARKLARAFRTLVYIPRKELPVEERVALNSQIGRAAQSIEANIAEGFGRYSHQENIQFCRQARGPAYEVRDHLVTAVDASFISKAKYDSAEALAQRAIQTLNGYTLNQKKTGRVAKNLLVS